MSAALSDREAEVYDRQMRLWGTEAQQRLKSSVVLLAGFTGVNAEVRRWLDFIGRGMRSQRVSPCK